MTINRLQAKYKWPANCEYILCFKAPPVTLNSEYDWMTSDGDLNTTGGGDLVP